MILLLHLLYHLFTPYISAMCTYISLMRGIGAVCISRAACSIDWRSSKKKKKKKKKKKMRRRTAKTTRPHPYPYLYPYPYLLPLSPSRTQLIRHITIIKRKGISNGSVSFILQPCPRSRDVSFPSFFPLTLAHKRVYTALPNIATII